MGIGSAAWRGSTKFRLGGSGFWNLHWGTSFCLSEGGEGTNLRENLQKIRRPPKALAGRQRLFVQKVVFFWPPSTASQLKGRTVEISCLSGGHHFFGRPGGISPLPPLPTYKQNIEFFGFFQIPMSCTPNQWRRRQKNQGGSSRPSSRNRRTFYSSSSVLYSSNSSGALSSSSSSSSPSNSADRFPRSPDKADSKLAQQQQRRRQNQISRSRLLPPRGRCPRVRW